eukprot:8631405-Pyramimonas_sp.AAC.1
MLFWVDAVPTRGRPLLHHVYEHGCVPDDTCELEMVPESKCMCSAPPSGPLRSVAACAQGGQPVSFACTEDEIGAAAPAGQ